MGDAGARGDLRTALVALRDALSRLPLALSLPARDRAVAERRDVVRQVDDYLLPRLARIDAPLLAVLGGSTGSGKSTIVNSLVGREVSAASVRRPTTNAPVLVCHPSDRAAFDGDGVLPDMPRTSGGDAGGLRVVVDEGVRPGLALLDSPDIDSVAVAHHDLAAQLLGAADLWLFVTTAARYADAVPWAHLEHARERGVALAIIVNRVPPGATDTVLEHLRTMLEDHGLGDTRLFGVEEGPLDDGRITQGLDEVRAWVASLAEDDAARRAVVRQSLAGAVASIPDRVARVRAAGDEQRAAVAALAAVVERRFDAALEDIEQQVGTGTVLRDEVLERFREAVPTAGWMDDLQRVVGRLRDRARALVTGTEVPVAEVRGALEHSLAAVVRRHVDEAALDVTESWRSLPGGDDVLGVAGDQRLDRSSTPFDERVASEISRWQDRVVQLVRDEAGGKMTLARGLSVGVNTIGVALMIVVFASTGGVTGGEAAVAGGTAAVSQALLSAVFGEQAVRDLARRARTDLLDRLEDVVDVEKARFEALLAPLVDDAAVAELQDALADLQRAQ